MGIRFRLRSNLLKEGKSMASDVEILMPERRGGKESVVFSSRWHAIQDRWLIILYRGGNLEAIHARTRIRYVNERIYVRVYVCVHISRRKIKLRFHGITALEFNFYPGLKQRYLLPRNSNWLAISSRSNFHYSRQIVSVDIGLRYRAGNSKRDEVS